MEKRMNAIWAPILFRIMRQAPKIIAVLLVIPIVIERKKTTNKDKRREAQE
jgi:hypothetical protein